MVEALKADADAELTGMPGNGCYRPGALMRQISNQEDGYQVKRITVASGQKLSLQYHHKRAEHWVVTQGKPLCKWVMKNLKSVRANIDIFRSGEKHRLTNVGDCELVLVEVQVGIIWVKTTLCVWMMFMGEFREFLC